MDLKEFAFNLVRTDAAMIRAGVDHDTRVRTLQQVSDAWICEEFGIEPSRVSLEENPS